MGRRFSFMVQLAQLMEILCGFCFLAYFQSTIQSAGGAPTKLAISKAGYKTGAPTRERTTMQALAEKQTSHDLSRGILVKVIQQDLVRKLEVIERNDAMLKVSEDEQLAGQLRISCAEVLDQFGQLTSMLYTIDPESTDQFFDDHAKAVKTAEGLGFDYRSVAKPVMCVE